MKKAKPKKTASDEKSGDSEKVTLKKLDQATAIVKAGLTTAGKFADWGKQANASKASIESSKARVQVAEEKTKQVVWGAAQKMHETDRLRQKDSNEHTQAMAKLQMEHEQMMTLNLERERVLDKMLEEPASLDQLAHSYRALIPPKP
ncbi:MAG TPA: hypothetical protein PK873_14725 [Pseudomonas sp.]|uniref:hypothetical protein n=1 Tax=Pseudomonas sp. TaxID=306 RepID=UPI002D100B69|nr:hypothetical protein [Pseudomonas sp.]HRL94804.1 hypothetical protein [Pseudomonas sp.]